LDSSIIQGPFSVAPCQTLIHDSQLFHRRRCRRWRRATRRRCTRTRAPRGLWRRGWPRLRGRPPSLGRHTTAPHWVMCSRWCSRPLMRLPGIPSSPLPVRSSSRGSRARAHMRHSSTVTWDALSSLPSAASGRETGLASVGELLRVGVSTLSAPPTRQQLGHCLPRTV
jgi:hypothetical protein